MLNLFPPGSGGILFKLTNSMPQYRRFDGKLTLTVLRKSAIIKLQINGRCSYDNAKNNQGCRKGNAG